MDKQTLRQPLFMDVVPRTSREVDQTIHSFLTASAPTFQSVIAGFETLSWTNKGGGLPIPRYFLYLLCIVYFVFVAVWMRWVNYQYLFTFLVRSHFFVSVFVQLDEQIRGENYNHLSLVWTSKKCELQTPLLSVKPSSPLEGVWITVCAPTFLWQCITSCSALLNRTLPNPWNVQSWANKGENTYWISSHSV